MMVSDFKNRFYGCCMAFISAMTFAVQGMLFKFINSVFYSETILIRIVPTVLCVLPILIYRKERLFGDRRQVFWLTLSSLSLAADLCVRYYAIVLIPFADVYALALSGVMVLTLIFGRLFLKETCGLFETIICVIILIGMALVSRPVTMFNAFQEGVTSEEARDWIRNRLLGCLFAVLSCFCCVGIALFTRKCSDVHFSVIVVHGAFWSGIVAAINTAVLGEWTLPDGGEQWLYLAGFSLVGTGSILTLFCALTYEEAGAVSTIRAFEVPVSYLLQIVFMHVYPTIVGAVGAAIIFFAAVTYGLRSWKLARNAENAEKEKYLQLS